MKKWFALALAVLIVAVAVPALADVTVTATIDKTKDKTVIETLTKDKDVIITVTSDLLLEGAAEVEAIVNVTNVGNTVDWDPEVSETSNISRHTTLADSVNSNSGVLGVNQDVGNMVNQANVVSFGFTDSPTAFLEAQAAADQVNTANQVFQNESELFDPGRLDRSATIGGENGSINSNSGIVGVNQNAGNMNNQTNAVALAVGAGAFVALSEADLGQFNSGNLVEEIATNKADLIANSISGNAGIVSVNQSSGNMNNQAAVISMAVRTSTVSLSSVPGQ
jgi:hypothetical protein